MGDQTVHLFGKGLVYRAFDTSTSPTCTRGTPPKGEGIGREEHATFGDDAENLRRDEEKW
jgi:hypothetical protein